MVREKINTLSFTVGTGVPDCVEYLLFSGEEKRSKKVAGDYCRDCVPADAPGRNYKLLPALATNSPPDCLLNASRPLTLFGKSGYKRLFSYCRDFRPLDCPIVVFEKASVLL